MTSSCCQADAGGEHTLARTNSGAILSAGACGLGWCRSLAMVPTLFGWRTVNIPEPITTLHAAYYHNLAIGHSGKLYSWGCGTFVDGNNDGVIPALGQDREDRGESPSLVHDVHAIAISGGAYHSIVLDNQHRVLTFGAGQLGQLGRSLEHSPSATNDGAGLPVDPVPRPVEGDDNYTHEHVERVGSGFYNTLAMCRSGALYCAGENQNRQCGVMGGTNNIFKMSRVIEVKDKHVVASEGGYCHTLVLDQNGEVMTLGCGDEGQRGDGVSEAMYEEMQGSSSRPVVSQVTLPCRAIGIAAGANHSVVLGENGEVFAFGSNEYGQCGLTMSTSSDGRSNSDEDDDNDSSHVLAPVRVMLPADAGRAVSVSAGYAHTVVRDEHGAVFTFGQNENGQLGLGCVIGVGVEARASPTKVSFG